MNLFDTISDMSPIALAAQIFGIVAMAMIILSFQFKKNTGHFIMQALGCALFCVSYLMLGNNWSGFMMDALSMTRALILLGGEKTNKPILLWAQLGAGVVALCVTIFVFHETWWLAILPFMAQTANLLGSWERHPRKMRWVQLGAVSPCWLAYNLLISPISVGGIICEIFNMVSVCVYFVRMHILKKQGKDVSAV